MASLPGSNFRHCATKNSIWIEGHFIRAKVQPQKLKDHVAAILALLETCAKSRDSHSGARLHDGLCRNGLLGQCLDVFISMYARCSDLAKAKNLLSMQGTVDIFAWNALIASMVRIGDHQNVLYYYDMMQNQGPSPNAMTFACILKSCSSQKLLEKGEEIHDDIAKQGLLKNNVMLGNALVTMYVKCGALARARLVLDGLPVRNAISWNTLITGYVDHGKAKECLDCFEQMQSEGVGPSAVTFASILKACGSMQALDKGEVIHEEISKQGLLENDVVLGTALINMYSKCGVFAKARLLLEELHIRDVVTWTVIISGYAKHGKFLEAFECFELMKSERLCPDVCSWTSVIAGFIECDENIKALHCFDQMRCSGILPDAATYTCVLKACGSMGAFSKGEEIHNEISQEGSFQNSVALGTALVDMYARCGALRKAQEVFMGIPGRDVVSWTTLIKGLMQQGQIAEALNCFCIVEHEGLSPDAGFFSCLITACSRSGLVKDAQSCFENMGSKYGMKPDLRHYTGMVDVFGRIGQLDKAFEIMNSLISFDLRLGSSFLSSCHKWGDANGGRFIFDQVVLLK